MNRLARPSPSAMRCLLRFPPASSSAIAGRVAARGCSSRRPLSQSASRLSAAAPPLHSSPNIHQLRRFSAEAHPSPSFDATAAAPILNTPQSANAAVLVVSQNAANRINEINKRTNSSKMLRVTVESGGCHGFQYKMELTTETDPEDDTVFDLDGARVVVDSVSLDFVGGSTLDYVEELIGSSFQVTNNPKAESSCGCKTSFNVKF
ncbi:[4Fe-4S] proteins maturation [Geranomyces variabilis]|nr:[4Fe-4S] proteins maturation [Geranomyces variabilis]